MFLRLILFIAVWAGIQNPPAQQTTKPGAPGPASTSLASVPALLKIHRICVESFGDDPVSRQLQGMVISALTESKKFTITENCERADATMKGVTTEQVHQEAHSTSEETSVGGSAASSDYGGSVSHSSHMGIADSSHSTETINDAHLAVRLVDKESGDVIWSTTQESSGAKYKSASADAADKVVKKLMWDIEKLEKLEMERTRDSDKKPSAKP